MASYTSQSISVGEKCKQDSELESLINRLSSAGYEIANLKRSLNDRVMKLSGTNISEDSKIPCPTDNITNSSICLRLSLEISRIESDIVIIRSIDESLSKVI